jgi:F-type H+-transporting ATPase subunit delta
MSTQDRAQSFAEAFYEAALERSLAALQAAANAIAKEPGLVARAQASQVEFVDRRSLLDGMLPADADAPVRNLLYTLAQHGELALLPDVIAALRGLVTRSAEAATHVEAVSAVPLTDKERATLAASLAAQYGSDLEFHYRIDPAILGGLIIRVGDKLIDGSVASKLAAMKQALGVTSSE